MKLPLNLNSFHVRKSVDVTIKDVKGAYRVHGHDVIVCLKSNGKYYICGEVREDDELYHAVVKEVTERMLDAYSRREQAFTCMHKSSPAILLTEDVKTEMALYEQAQFKRADFPLFKPVTNDVERELEHEAAIRFGNVLEDRTAEREQFVRDRLKEEYSARVLAWTDALAFHKSVQDFKERQYNKLSKGEYERTMLSKRSFLEGKSGDVERSLKDLLSKLQLPFDISVNCRYQQAEQRLVTQIELPDNLELPDKEAHLSAAGLIEITAKTDSELDAMRTDTILSMVYHIGATLFTASANITVHKVDVWLSGCSDALLAVEFLRSDMACLNLKHICLLADYYKRRRRDNISVSDDIINLLPMGVGPKRTPIASQENMAAEPQAAYAQRSDAASNSSRNKKFVGFHYGCKPNWEVEIDIALEMCDLLPNDPVLQVLVRAAHEVGQLSVHLPGKYQEIWEQINVD
ncbi:MAG: hypothetical protein NC217_01285 [Muribaculaceae bacterium]|nr:hypothetical protein [Muribaculaceae bacterium]